MKEQNVISVLMYLFQYHMKNSASMNIAHAELFPHLEQVGFTRPAIVHAFAWLSNLIKETANKPEQPSLNSFRAFSPYELEYFNLDCRRYLLFLEEKKILNTITRELVIDQALALGSKNMDVPLIKWVTMMVLFNQPEEKAALAHIEHLVLHDHCTDGVH